MKAIYTEAAQRELEAFKAHQQELLEGLVAERKLVLGDEVLEITASDIKSASERIRIYRPPLRRTQSTELVMRAYIVLGVVMMLGSFFYPQLLELYSSNKTQALIFFMGATMAAVGWVFNYWVQTRRKRMLDEAEAYASFLKRKEFEFLKSSSRPEGEA